MPEQPKWYQVKAQAITGQPSTAEIYIYGNIGDTWDENGVIAADLVRELAQLNVDEITLRINSYGGSVPDGLVIYNALKRHKATCSVHVDGVAISCASYIAMAGDSITMAENALMMVHAPWGYASGNATSMRAAADVLDKYAHALATSYADKTGKPLADCMALLSDGQDHWYTAAEALAEGFADSVGPAVEIAAKLAGGFDLARYGAPRSAHKFTHPAAQAAAITQEQNMPEATPAAAAAPTPFARTREMNTEILAICKPFLARDGIQALQTEILADPAITVEQAQAKLLTTLGKSAEPITPAGAFAQVETVEAEADKLRAAAVSSIIARAGLMKDPAQRAALSGNPFRGAKLLDLARASLDRAGVNHRGMGQMEVVAAAFTQGTSDFPVILENAMHKVLQGAYATAALTWRRFCATGSVGDFRAHNRYRVGSLGNLESVNELGEFKNKTIPDSEKASISAGTKGNIINLSRQAVVNDDLGAFMTLSDQLGRAAARTIEADVYALLALNSGLGPTMADTYTLFHANHGNLTTGAALSVAGIEADRVAMAAQKDVSGNDYLDLRPQVLLVSTGLGGTARVINSAEYDPDTANKLQRPNMVRGLFSDVVDTPRLTGNRRYLFANPTEAPVIEVAFLDGAEDPYLEIQDGFDVDGARYKVRLDFGIAAVDYRGAITNAGQ